MRLKGRVFLVDMDGTLINASGIKSFWEKSLGKKFTKEYENSKKKFGFFNIKYLSMHLNVNKEFFYKTPFDKFLYPKSLALLRKLKKLGKVIIFTQGDPVFQKYKFQNSKIQDIVGKRNLLITKNKATELKKILPKLKVKYSTIVIIDDRLDILGTAVSLDPEILTVWIRQNSKAVEKIPSNDFANFSFTSAFESFELVNKFVNTLPQKSFKYKLSVVRGLNKNYISQLIDLTNNDSRIQNFTHDKKRFSNEKCVNNWLKDKRKIYILTNTQQRLLGIIWFTFDGYRGSNWTFAIRLYKLARGKGLALPFMKVVFDDFDPRNKTSVWLSTDSKNRQAEDLYRKFGFVSKETIKDRVYMIKNP